MIYPAANSTLVQTNGRDRLPATPWTPPTGDQAYYLIETISLVQDRDFDVANNYALRMRGPGLRALAQSARGR